MSLLIATMGDAPPEGSRLLGERIFPVDNPTTPYWRTELHRFDSYRSTEDLPSECDVAIIGSGMAGVSTAYHLVDTAGKKKAPSIVLLEARQLCSGATARNGVSPLHLNRTSICADSVTWSRENQNRYPHDHYRTSRSRSRDGV